MKSSHRPRFFSLGSLLNLCGGLAIVGLCGCNPDRELHPFRVAGSSMEPAFHEGDRMFADEGYYRHHPIADEDIVIFRHNGSLLIKRVSALPGETIEEKDGTLFRNGKALVEPYAQHSGHLSADDQTSAEQTIPAGEVFVTGDNRDKSFDSRQPDFGAVKTTDIIGRSSFAYWPSR